ncbi:hypothetical protein [Herbaspirillum rubrisubalbicans]|uniref:Uncharacterized protein n=1 Tax=Herbaspirillum rubrisubalbicans TaxID=80842 RepID=A0ABX9BVC1_9BURK|nr:hypothetical protein [Herbaspirillum rubrisubalbicans]RAM61757.1 hypothetical protein RB24_24195 [Herbaspirillum rubrisubalbicans]
MSTTFNNFIKQYHRSGSEKADGYDKSSFIRLADHEKKSVFEMLVSELPWIGAIEGLFLLDPVRALEICKKEEEKLRIAGSAAYMLQPFLVKYSGDLIYQRHLIEDYSGYYDDLKPKVVDAVSRTPITTDSIEFFKSVVLTEANTSAVARASRHLLDALRLPHDEDEDKARYQQLLVDLRSENIQTKLRCLEKINRLAVAHHRSNADSDLRKL